MYRFDKSHRLLKKSDYGYVFSEAKKLVTSELIVLYRENTIGHARLGLALSKKMIPKAHDRNRVKRVVRETFRTQSLPAMDIVVLARNGAANVQNTLVMRKLCRLWEKLCEN